MGPSQMRHTLKSMRHHKQTKECMRATDTYLPNDCKMHYIEKESCNTKMSNAVKHKLFLCNENLIRNRDFTLGQAHFPVDATTKMN